MPVAPPAYRRSDSTLFPEGVWITRVQNNLPCCARCSDTDKWRTPSRLGEPADTNDETVKKYRWFQVTLVLREQFQSAPNPPTLEICLVNNRAIGSTERKTSGVSYSITSPCGLSMGGISADAACGITRCAGSKLLESAGLQASIRARPDAGH
jgi:hypothetical protein